jgi:hypothetical protein
MPAGSAEMFEDWRMRIEDVSAIFPPTGRKGSRRVAPLMVALVILVSTCGCQEQHGPLPDLQLRGSTQIPGLTDLQRQGADDQIYYIDSVAAYAPSDGPGGARILFQLTQYFGPARYTPLFDVGLDGRGLRSIPLRQPCDGPVTVSHDGRWAACQDQAGIEVTALNTRRSDGGRQVLTGAFEDDLQSPSWSPDGGHLAVVTHAQAGGCAIAIYTGQSPHTVLRKSALLTFPTIAAQDSSAPSCSPSPSQLAWSPDGAWLAFEDMANWPGDRLPVYGLLVPALTQSPAPNAPVATIPITSAQLVPLGRAGWPAPLTWSLAWDGLDLAYIGTTWGSAVQVSVTTRRQMTLIDFSANTDAGGMCALSWTRDSRDLVFVDCFPGNFEIYAVPSKVYYYTPGTG